MTVTKASLQVYHVSFESSPLNLFKCLTVNQDLNVLYFFGFQNNNG